MNLETLLARKKLKIKQIDKLEYELRLLNEQIDKLERDKQDEKNIKS